MNSLKFCLKTKKLELVKSPVLRIRDSRQVLVKVAFAGICGTDLHIISGEFPCESQVPFTLGHEFGGTVEDVGALVTVVKKGDKVVVDPNKGCGVCKFCHSGNPHYCKVGGINNTIGIFKDGGWADYALVPEDQIFKLPECVSLRQAALIEPISCMAHGWDRVSPVHVGQRILVTGAGIIGNLWAANLHLQGHRKVTISEPNASRRALVAALDTGFECISPDELKKRQLNEPDYLFDLVVDCSGFGPAIEHASALLDSGGKLCIFGVAPPHHRISLAPFDIYMKELTVVGVNINPFTFPKAVGIAEALTDRYLDYQKLGVQTFALQDYETALACLKSGSISKAIFQL